MIIVSTRQSSQIWGRGSTERAFICIGSKQ